MWRKQKTMYTQDYVGTKTATGLGDLWYIFSHHTSHPSLEKKVAPKNNMERLQAWFVVFLPSPPFNGQGTSLQLQETWRLMKKWQTWGWWINCHETNQRNCYQTCGAKKCQTTWKLVFGRKPTTNVGLSCVVSFFSTGSEQILKKKKQYAKAHYKTYAW